MNQLPAIPAPGSAIALSDVVAIETGIAQQLIAIDDMAVLEEMRAKAEALACYLQGKELHGPMIGAQRRIEARIGQLLGEAPPPGRPKENLVHGQDLDQRLRHDMRVLARGMGQLADEEWRQSRASLLKLIHQRFPMPRRTPEIVVQRDGGVKKSRAARAKEITRLVESGARAAQIADQLGISEDQVRKISKEEGIVLPDAAIGKRPKLDPVRILTETIMGIDAYVSGISLLDGASLQGLSQEQRKDLLQALARSLTGLKKLRHIVEGSHEGSSATAA